MKVLIIGASFSGIQCAIRAKELYPYDDIEILDQEEEIGYLPSGLTLLMNQSIQSLDEAIFVKKEKILRKGIKLSLGIKAVNFDFSKQIVQTTKGDFFYDRLVLAMGSTQESQKLMNEHPNFLTYKRKSQAQYALEKIKGSQSIAIIGAGQTGMELASSLIKQGKDVILIESMNYPLYKSFDATFLEPVINELEQLDNLVATFSQTVKEVKDCGSQVLIKTSKEKIKVDIAFLATNVRPDLSIFKEKLKTHMDQTLKVNDYLQTSEKNVFAVGDLIQVFSPLLDQTVYLPLINNAVRSGRICAENLKENKIPYKGAVRVVGTKVLDYYLASCGLIESDQFLYSDPVASKIVTVPYSTLNEEQVKLKLIFNNRNRKVIGVQIISKINVLEKINLYAMAIDQGMTIEEVLQTDYFYHPLFANPFLGIGQPNQEGQNLYDI